MNKHTVQEGCQPLLQIHYPHRLDKIRLWVTSSSPSQEDQEEEEEPEIPEWPQEQEVEEKQQEDDESPQSTLSSPVEQEWEVKEDQYIPPEESQPESPQTPVMKNVKELLPQLLHKRHVIRRMNRTRSPVQRTLKF